MKGQAFQHVTKSGNYHYTKGPRRISKARQGIQDEKKVLYQAQEVAVDTQVAQVRKSIFHKARSVLATALRALRGS